MLKSLVLAGLASVVLTVSVQAPVQAKEWKEIRIASEGAYPPFNYMSPDGKLVGFDLDIANALCEAMEAKCTIVANDWDGMIPGLQANKFDAVIASMAITDERKKLLPSPTVITRRRLPSWFRRIRISSRLSLPHLQARWSVRRLAPRRAIMPMTFTARRART